MAESAQGKGQKPGFYGPLKRGDPRLRGLSQARVIPLAKNLVSLHLGERSCLAEYQTYRLTANPLYGDGVGVMECLVERALLGYADRGS